MLQTIILNIDSYFINSMPTAHRSMVMDDKTMQFLFSNTIVFAVFQPCFKSVTS